MEQIVGYSRFSHELENYQVIHVQIQQSTNQTKLLIGLKRLMIMVGNF